MKIVSKNLIYKIFSNILIYINVAKNLAYGSKVESASAGLYRTNIQPQNGTGNYIVGETIIVNIPTYGRSRGRFEGTVNAMVTAGDDHDEDSGGDSSDGEPPDADPDAEVQEAVDSDDSDDQKPVESKEEGDLDEVKDIPAEDEWLHGVVMDPQGKRPPPCWKFATTGKCQYGDQCRFSHHPDDVKAYNAAKAIGHSAFKSMSGQKVENWATERRGHGSSPGVRPRVPTPTSILKAGADGTKRKV